MANYHRRVPLSAPHPSPMTSPNPSTTEFDVARSGVLAGVIVSGCASVLFGLVLGAGVIDLCLSLVAPRSIQLTSLLVVGFGAVGAVVFGLLALSSYRTLSLWRRLHEQSVVTSGTLGAPRRTNTRVNRRYLYEIPLTVTPPDGAPYEAVARWFVPSDVREHALAGARVVVRVDARDRTAVLVDWDQTRASWGLPPARVE